MLFQVKTSRNSCCALGCSNNPAKRPELSFHHFPKGEERWNAWVATAKSESWSPAASSVLCSEHFSREAFRRPPGLDMRAILKPDAVPSIFQTYLQPTHPKKRSKATRVSEPDERAIAGQECSHHDKEPERVRSHDKCPDQRQSSMDVELPDRCKPDRHRKSLDMCIAQLARKLRKSKAETRP